MVSTTAIAGKAEEISEGSIKGSLLRSFVANPEALAGYARPDGRLIPEPAGGFRPRRAPTLAGSAVRYLIVTSDDPDEGTS